MKKIVIAIVVFDRIGNFIKWLKLADIVNKSRYRDFYDIEFRIIHNRIDPILNASWEKIANQYNSTTYLKRENVGMDIGAFKSICDKSFTDFKQDFDYLIWFTDDCFPTSLEFIKEFIDPLEANEKLVSTCFEISRTIRPHIRTTGFCLRKEFLEKIVFPPRVTTKQDCYDFEHGQNSLYMQILKMRLEAKQIEKNIFYNPDSSRIKQLGLEKCLENLYNFLYGKKEPDVLIFATAHNRYPQIISSVVCQKHSNLALEVWHNGKIDLNFLETYNFYNEFENVYVKELEFIPGNHYGHPVKKKYLETLNGKAFEYILITNEDNYISPYFIQKAIETLERFPELVGAYCNGMIHNYKPDIQNNSQVSWREKRIQKIEDGHSVDGYGLIPCKIERGYIDISSIVFRTNVAISESWNDSSHSADWTFIENICKNFGGKEKFSPFPGIHLVHN